MSRATPQSFLCKITHIEGLIRLVKDDFLRERILPDRDIVNSIRSELDSLSKIYDNKNIVSTNKTRKSQVKAKSLKILC